MASPISFRTNILLVRIVLLATALLLLVGSIFVLRWCLADAASTRVTDPVIAELLARWAPGDPQTHYALAGIYEKGYLPEDTARAADEYEKAAALSPYDYRYLLPLARAREHNGNIDGAEKILRYALSLAPNYAQVHWALGNVLLRQGKTDEAFAEMRQAINANPAFAVTAAATALQFSDEGYTAILQKLGNSPATKTAMALALARQNNFDDSLAIWYSLPDEERNISFKEQGNELFKILLTAKKFREAAQVNYRQAPGTISDPGFEDPIDLSDTSPFKWQIAQGSQPVIGVDSSQKHGGGLSLGIVFAKNSGKDFRQISQTVPVESNSGYHFRVFLRSDISAAGALKWELIDAETGVLLGATKDITGANGQWEELSADIKTSALTEGVLIRLVKTGCQNCSIEGKVWFDDLALEKR